MFRLQEGHIPAMSSWCREMLQAIELDRGCFSCALGGANRKTLFMVATEWHGPNQMMKGPRTGRILTAPVAVPGIG
jgi:sugar lactone lactonase YvrE